MARIKLSLPKHFYFSTEIPVKITDINYGGHLGNDKFLALIHEARVRFLKQWDMTELNIDGVGLVVVDAVLIYKAEVFYGDLLTIHVAVENLNKFGCDFYYKMFRSDGQEACRAKTGVVFFNFQTRKMAQMPEKFAKIIRVLNSKQ